MVHLEDVLNGRKIQRKILVYFYGNNKKNFHERNSVSGASLSTFSMDLCVKYSGYVKPDVYIISITT